MKDKSPGEAVLCIPGMSLLCHLGHFWGLLVASSATPGALCTPPGGRLLGGGVPLGTHSAEVGRTWQQCGWLTPLAWEDGMAGMARQGWHGKGGTARMSR